MIEDKPRFYSIYKRTLEVEFILMKIDANSIRVGYIIEYNGKLWVVLKTMHTQPGKGGAYMQVELKDLEGKIKNNVRFRSSEFVEKAQLSTKAYQYLYLEGNLVHLMEQETYEQITIDSALLGEQIGFLADDIVVKVDFYDSKPVAARLPETVEVEVVECEPVVKGQTVTSSYKPALLENRVRIMVPQFIHPHDKIVIKTETKEYVERV